MLFNRKKRTPLFYFKKSSYLFPFFFVPVNRDEFRFCVYIGKNCPGKPRSWVFNGEIPFFWDSFLSLRHCVPIFGPKLKQKQGRKLVTEMLR